MAKKTKPSAVYDFHKEMDEHMSLIAKLHRQEMAKIQRSLDNPAPVVCAHCRCKMAEEMRLIPTDKPSLKVVGGARHG
jgi:hypothetical protein